MKKVKLKIFSNKTKVLVRSSKDAAGYDLYSTENIKIKRGGDELILIWLLTFLKILMKELRLVQVWHINIS